MKQAVIQEHICQAAVAIKQVDALIAMQEHTRPLQAPPKVFVCHVTRPFVQQEPNHFLEVPQALPLKSSVVKTARRESTKPIQDQKRVRHVLVAAMIMCGMIVEVPVQEIVINVLGVQQDGKSLAVQRVKPNMNCPQVDIPVGLAKRAPVTNTGLCGVGTIQCNVNHVQVLLISATKIIFCWGVALHRQQISMVIIKVAWEIAGFALTLPLHAHQQISTESTVEVRVREHALRVRHVPVVNTELVVRALLLDHVWRVDNVA